MSSAKKIHLSRTFISILSGIQGTCQSSGKKCKRAGQNFQRSLSVFRNMHRSDGPSPAQLLFQLPQKINILLQPWPVLSINTNSAFASRAHHIKQHTAAIAAINTRAFPYTRLPLGCRVFVQNAITKQWDQQANVKARRNNGESYVIELSNGKQCVGGRILLRPITIAASPAYTSHASPVPAPTSTRSTHPVAVPTLVLRRSARLQNKV